MFRTSTSDRAYLALIAASAAWGMGTVISKRAVEEIPPLALLPFQLASSLVVLAVLLTVNRLPFRDPSAPAALERLGVLNPGLSYALGLLGLVSISASLAVLIWALEPLLILILAAWFLRERMGRAMIALSLVAAAGVFLVVYDPATSGSLLGIALTLAGVLCCAIYTTATRRWLTNAQETASVVASQQGWALAFAVVVAAIAWASAVRCGQWIPRRSPSRARPYPGSSITALPTGCTSAHSSRCRHRWRPRRSISSRCSVWSAVTACSESAFPRSNRSVAWWCSLPWSGSHAWRDGATTASMRRRQAERPPADQESAGSHVGQPLLAASVTVPGTTTGAVGIGRALSCVAGRSSE